ncbi:MAG: hypothetical protein FJ134_14355 [Deltaproteobacteria bacterium]|nr:hypothetical protein [Deltaproteobacteria bacterium]
MPWLFKSSLHRLRVMEKPGEIWLWDNKGLSLYLNFYRGTGEAQIASERNWQDVLRVSYFFKFLERRGLLLHASGLVRRGRAFLFPGETRAGKTTIVRQSPGVSVLSDEMPAVRLLENGGAPLAYGTPLFGSWGRPGENLSAPLRGFYFPVKAIENRLTPIAPSKALSLLIQRVCSFTTWEPRLRQLVQLTEELVQRVPSFILEFRPRPDFWQVIDGT